MTTTKKPKGRPKRYSEYENILKEHAPKSMSKRPVYVNNIGIYRGKTGDTVYLKIHHRSRNKPEEIPKGRLISWSWSTLETERDRLQGRADRNEPLKDIQPITFKKYALDWLEMAKSYQKSYSTSMYCVTRQLIPNFGKKLLKDINVKDVNIWQAKRMKEASPATAKRDLSMLKSILNSAIKEELIDKNPCNNANKIKGIKGRMRYLTAKELLRITKEAEKIDPEFKDLILWASYSAMRRGEITSMKWSDIKHFDNGETKVHIPISKSDKPRHIPCNTHMLAILARQRKRISESDERVFAIAYRTIGRRMRTIQSALKEEGVNDIRFHDLRTLNITNALLSGVDPNTLTGITGHSDLQMINKHYAVLVDKAMDKASQKSGDYIDSLLQEAETELEEKQVGLNNVVIMKTE